MDHTIKHDDGSLLSWRETPWNDQVYGVKTREILGVEYVSSRTLFDLLNAYERLCESANADFTCIRIDAKGFDLKSALQRQGYYFAEGTYKIGFRLRSKSDRRSWAMGNLELTEAAADDIVELKNIVQTNFSFGRFFEDPNFDVAMSKHRNALWIESAIGTGKRCLIYRSGGKIRTFFLVDVVVDNGLNVLLAGSRKGSDLIMPRFLASCLNSLADEGYASIEAIVSSSNLGVVNMVSGLKAKFMGSLLGFHKWHGR